MPDRRIAPIIPKNSDSGEGGMESSREAIQMAEAAGFAANSYDLLVELSLSDPLNSDEIGVSGRLMTVYLL